MLSSRCGTLPHMARSLHSIVFLLLLLAPILVAQDRIAYQEAAERKFQHALEMYENGSHYSAATHFQQLAEAYPAHQRTTAAYIMAARAHLLAKAPTRSLRLLEEFRLQFPASSFIGESFLISGKAAAAADSPARAIEYYLRAWKNGVKDYHRFAWQIQQLGPVRLSPYDRKVTENILKSVAEAERLRVLLPLDDNVDRKEQRGGNTEPAAAAVEQTVPVIIPVALPASMRDLRKRRLVNDLRRGMQLALDEHNASAEAAVEMQEIPSDDLETLREVCSKLEKDPRAVIMLAGAFSEDARDVCEMIGEREILVLLPTATDAGLTDFGSNIFQMNTPIKDRARLLADFAFLELDAKAVSVLSPDDSYPRAMADAFVKRCREIGLSIRGQQFYRSAQTDLSEAFGRLSRGGGVKNCVLFAPVSSAKHIGSVLQGAAMTTGIHTILGGGNWNYPNVLTRHASNSTIYFESDVLAEKGQRSMRALLHKRGERRNGSISREMLFGFDAMTLALRVAGNEPTTRAMARKKLRDIFEGLRAPVNFIDSRVNRAMNMLRCRKGEIELLDSFYAK